MYELPRKFNIAFDNGGSISVLADTNDIGFVAVRVGEGRTIPPGIYFRVLLCGITGHRQFASDAGLLLRPEETVAVAAAMIASSVSTGIAPIARRRAWNTSSTSGVSSVSSKRHKSFCLCRSFVSLHRECEPRRAIDRAVHLGIHAQSQPGLHYIGVSIPVGRLPSAQMRALAKIADDFGSGELRLTVWQNLIVPNIATEHVEAAKEALLAAGLGYEAGTS